MFHLKFWTSSIRKHMANAYRTIQHRVVQDTILYKDDRLREAQAWISRVQEMDALQSTTLQAELRERTEQYNQLWLGCQRQVDLIVVPCMYFPLLSVRFMTNSIHAFR